MSKKKASQITQVLKSQQRAKEAFSVVPRLTNRRYALIVLILYLIIVACTNTYQSQKLAKEFLAYLIQPEVMGNYLKASGGRHLPVLTSAWEDPFWKNSKDPYLSAAINIFLNRETRPFYFVQNPAYSLVLKDNVWGKALNRIVVDKISSEQAADEAIARIKQIFDQWQ